MTNYKAEVNKRREHHHEWLALANILHAARNGKLRDPKLLVMDQYEFNQLRSAHDDHVTMAAKVFGIDVPSKRGSATSKDEAALVENVCRGYEHAAFQRGGLSHSSLKYWETWDLTLFGESVRMVMPDYNNTTPMFLKRDCKTHLPPIGWSPLVGPLTETMFAYQESLDALCARYHDNAEIYERLEAIRRSLNDHYNNAGGYMVDVIEKYTADHWHAVVCGPEGEVTLFESKTGDPGHPGVMPVTATWLYDGETKGRTTLADVLGLQKITTTVLSMTMEGIEQMLNPTVIHDPVEGGKLVRGYGKSNVFDQQYLQGRAGRVEKLSPDSPVPMMQIVEFITGHSRSQSKNPESLAGAGAADSAKALTELKSGPFAYIEKAVWGPQLDSEPRSYSIAMHMDRNLWGNERKQIPGKGKFYRPNTVLDGYESSVVMKPGFGPAGQAGEIIRIQKTQAGLMSRMEAFEEDPAVLDAVAHNQQIQMEQLDDLEFQMLMTKMQQEGGDWSTIAKIRKTMEDNECDRGTAIRILVDKGELGAAPPPAAMMPPDLGAAMAMGGGQDALAQGALPPSLGEMRQRALPAGAP